MKQRKPKRLRTIKNSIVDVDNVSEDRGLGNIQWLSVAKRKLMKRELILLQKRQQILNECIVASIQSFIDENQFTYNFNECMNVYVTYARPKLTDSQSSIMQQCRECIAGILQKWNGCKSTTEIRTFREFFQRCRHWFDTKKITTIAICFWIPIMKLIQEFAMKAAIQMVGSDMRVVFSDYLSSKIFRSVFQGRIKPANTRKMWLVPAMSYRTFLRRYNDNLRIPLSHNTTKNKALRVKYLECLHQRLSSLKSAFDTAMHQYLAPESNTPNILSVHNHNFNGFADYDPLYDPWFDHNRNNHNDHQYFQFNPNPDPSSVVMNDPYGTQFPLSLNMNTIGSQPNCVSELVSPAPTLAPWTYNMCEMETNLTNMPCSFCPCCHS